MTIPVAPVREAIEASGVPLPTIARACGYTYECYTHRKLKSGKRVKYGPQTKGDVRRLKRTLGYSEHKECKQPTEVIKHDVALLIVGAIGIDPVDVGL